MLETRLRDVGSTAISRSGHQGGLKCKARTPTKDLSVQVRS